MAGLPLSQEHMQGNGINALDDASKEIKREYKGQRIGDRAPIKLLTARNALTLLFTSAVTRVAVTALRGLFGPSKRPFTSFGIAGLFCFSLGRP